jgi:hypothetical protein
MQKEAREGEEGRKSAPKPYLVVIASFLNVWSDFDYSLLTMIFLFVPFLRKNVCEWEKRQKLSPTFSVP